MSLWDDALAAVNGVFGVPVLFTGAGLTSAEIIAVRMDRDADPFQGPGQTVRTVTYEVQQADFPERPRKGNQLLAGAILWRVIDVTLRDEIAAFHLTVEKAS